MELHRTIWKGANQPLLYRTLDLLMNPYIFIIARAYSSRIPLEPAAKATNSMYGCS